VLVANIIKITWNNVAVKHYAVIFKQNYASQNQLIYDYSMHTDRLFLTDSSSKYTMTLYLNTSG